MQERQVEATLFNEATLKLSRYVIDRTMPSIHDNVWDTYALHFAADAAPDEVDSFVAALPRVADSANTTLNHLPLSHAVQLYGALALRAGNNEELRDHSVRQLLKIQATEATSSRAHEIAPTPRQLFLEVITRHINPETAITMARTLATRNQEYKPDDHLLVLEDVAEAFETLDTSDETVQTAYWQLCDEALTAQAASKEDTGYTRHADAVMRSAIPRLYATGDRQRVIAYCEKYDLYPELALALHKNGEEPSLLLLGKAADSVFNRETFLTTGKLVADLHINYGHQQEAESLLKQRKAARHLGDSVWTLSAIHAAGQGNIEQALKYTKKIQDHLSAKRHTINAINKVLVEQGDIQRFCEAQDTYQLMDRQSRIVAIIKMAMRQDDIAQATAHIEQEDLPHRAYAYQVLAETYIAHHLEEQTPEAIDLALILDFLEKYKNAEDDPARYYAYCHRDLYDGGCRDLAQKFREAFYDRYPERKTAFNKILRDAITQEHIIANDWLNAMHGDHLEDPESGLWQHRYLALVAGGIHRARIQRKQQQEAQETKDLPK